HLQAAPRASTPPNGRGSPLRIDTEQPYRANDRVHLLYVKDDLSRFRRLAESVEAARITQPYLAMAHEFKYLFTPLRVGGLTLRNRIFSTAHAEAMAEDGKPGPRLLRYHESKARGGAALTIIGGSNSVHPSSPASAWNMIANHDESIVPAYRAVADAVHRHGCAIMSQLTHLG